VKIAASQFGIHVIQTTKLGKLTEQIQFAILERSVTPSTQTYGQVYARASQFASEYTTRDAFNKGAEILKLDKKIALLRETDRTIIGLETPRMLIRAAFDAKPGNVLRNTDGSPIFELGDNFVIAALANVTEEGFSSFESVKPRVELAVLKEKKSKMLAERINTAAQGKSDMKEIAYSLGAEVKTASNITFATSMIPDVGMEPPLIGTAVSLEANAISAPVTGNNGVYLIKAIEVRDAGDTNVEAEKQRLQQNLAYRNNPYQTFETLKKAVKIEDKRSKFY
jgi:peptidyl-prolyl cis-trans isomerase D